MSNVKLELRKYAVYQLMSYINEQTHGKFVSSGEIQKLSKGVENICIAAFGEEYYPIIKRETPRILRAALETRQLGLGGKMMKFFDNTKKAGGNDIVSMILGDIIGKDSAIVQSEKAGKIKASWIERIKSEEQKTTERVGE
mgnify:CR=1 FL=1